MRNEGETEIKRIFIAVRIEPGENLLNMISDFRSELVNEKIKWTGTENFHITLVFPGDTPEAKTVLVNSMLEQVCLAHSPFDIMLEGAGVFKNLADPRILWAGIRPSERLARLQLSVKEGLRETGFIAEDRAYNPHLTLGRIKAVRDRDALNALIGKYSNSLLQNQAVDSVILYQSLLLPTGPVYRPLAEYSLSGASGAGNL